MRKFPLTALYGAAGDGVVCKPVPFLAIFAPTKSLHFKTLLPHSFFFICPCICATIVPGVRKPRVCANFHLRTYTALQKTEQFAVPFRSIRFLHRLKIYIFRLSFPIASFSYAPCIGAAIVPDDRKPRVCANFHSRLYTALQGME